MFGCEVGNMIFFKDFFEALGSVFVDGTLVADESGIMIRLINEMRDIMISTVLPKETFEVYNCDTRTEIKLSFEELNKILKRVDKRSSIRIELDEQKNDLVLISDRKIKKTFRINLLDNTLCEIGPDGSLPVADIKFKIAGELFEEALKDAGTILDKYGDVVLRTDEDGLFHVRADGIHGEIELELEYELIEDVQKEVACAFKLVQLQKIMKMERVSTELVISLRNDSPMELEFSLGHFDGVDVKAEFFIAPIMTEEDYEEEEEENEELDEDTEDVEDSDEEIEEQEVSA